MQNGAVYELEVIGKPRSAKNSKQIGFFRDFSTKTGYRYTLVDSPAVKRWRKLALPQLVGQWVGHIPLAGKLAAIVTSYCGKGPTPDVDNLLSGPFDAMQRAEVVTNDKVFETAVSIRRRDVENPRTEILIMPDDFLQIEIRQPGCEVCPACMRTL
jgi:Holliday junction resolvase RusA-like endonuclease